MKRCGVLHKCSGARAWGHIRILPLPLLHAPRYIYYSVADRGPQQHAYDVVVAVGNVRGLGFCH